VIDIIDQKKVIKTWDTNSAMTVCKNSDIYRSPRVRTASARGKLRMSGEIRRKRMVTRRKRVNGG
jgi:hypothetical protein